MLLNGNGKFRVLIFILKSFYMDLYYFPDISQNETIATDVRVLTRL